MDLKYLYVLFICLYHELYLKPSPDTEKETNELWKWDVAELFIGSDFQDIKRYKEFEVSPQGEWVDLDINLALPHHETGWTWNSGFEVAARIDHEAHVWHGAMRIPFKAIDERGPAAGISSAPICFAARGRPDINRTSLGGLPWPRPFILRNDLESSSW